MIKLTSEQSTSLRRTGDQILLELARFQFKDDLQTTQCLSEGGNVFQIVEVLSVQKPLIQSHLVHQIMMISWLTTTYHDITYYFDCFQLNFSTFPIVVALFLTYLNLILFSLFL